MKREPFDDDVVLVLKDWRVGEEWKLPAIPDGRRRRALRQFRHAAGLSTATVAPRIAVPAGANIRLRLVNADSTRVGELGIGGAMASVIAIDGNAVAAVRAGDLAARTRDASRSRAPHTR